jgi:hypothetical protein
MVVLLRQNWSQLLSIDALLLGRDASKSMPLPSSVVKSERPSLSQTFVVHASMDHIHGKLLITSPAAHSLNPTLMKLAISRLSKAIRSWSQLHRDHVSSTTSLQRCLLLKTRPTLVLEINKISTDLMVQNSFCAHKVLQDTMHLMRTPEPRRSHPLRKPDQLMFPF